MKNHYTTLGVAAHATDKEIKAAWKRCARKYHPDRNPGNERAEQRFKACSEAQRVLLDAALRKEHDEELAYYALPVCLKCSERFRPISNLQRMCHLCSIASAVRPKPQPRPEPAISAEQQRLEREFGWVGDMDQWDDMISQSSTAQADSYNTDVSGLYGDDLLAALMGESVLRNAPHKQKQTSVHVELGDEVKIYVHQDSKNTVANVTRGLRSAQRVIKAISRFLK